MVSLIENTCPFIKIEKPPTQWEIVNNEYKRL